jgi:hypothetical protein
MKQLLETYQSFKKTLLFIYPPLATTTNSAYQPLYATPNSLSHTSLPTIPYTNPTAFPLSQLASSTTKSRERKRERQNSPTRAWTWKRKSRLIQQRLSKRKLKTLDTFLEKLDQNDIRKAEHDQIYNIRQTAYIQFGFIPDPTRTVYQERIWILGGHHHSICSHNRQTLPSTTYVSKNHCQMDSNDCLDLASNSVSKPHNHQARYKAFWKRLYHVSENQSDFTLCFETKWKSQTPTSLSYIYPHHGNQSGCMIMTTWNTHLYLWNFYCRKQQQNSQHTVTTT